MAALLCCAACGGQAEGPRADEGRMAVRVRLINGKDSASFTAPAALRRCGAATGRGGFVLDGVAKGDGALLWLRTADSLPVGDYPVLTRWDTLAERGAVVAIRYLIGEMAHGLALDSGSVTVTAGGADRFAARLVGGGLEMNGARRLHVEARFDDLTLAADTVACRVRL